MEIRFLYRNNIKTKGYVYIYVASLILNEICVSRKKSTRSVVGVFSLWQKAEIIETALAQQLRPANDSENMKEKKTVQNTNSFFSSSFQNLLISMEIVRGRIIKVVAAI